MAKRSSSKKASKHYPVQRKITLRETGSPQTNDTQMQVLVDRELSHINHRLYRQSRVYNCKVEIDSSLATGMAVDVYALSDTWMNMKAYQFAKKTYDKNSAEELDAISKSNIGRWNDFRVQMSATTTVANMRAIGHNIVTYENIDDGDYETTIVTDAAGVEHVMAWVGSGTEAFNIIDEYDRTGDTAYSPTFPQNVVGYADLDDQIDSDMVDHLTGQGNEPPYADRELENACFSKVGRLFVDGEGQGKLSTGFFDAPCGMILLIGSGGATSITLSDSLTVVCKAGDYKGVHAPSYLE
jgi:hypothetical protein